MCKHKELYGIEASWNFFATSHGKSACDGIAGTIKRSAAKESLRRPSDNPIATVDDLYNFCVENFPTIMTFLIKKEEIDEFRSKMTNNAETVPGTRSYHKFCPINVIACKIIGFHEKNTLVFNLVEKVKYYFAQNMYVTFVFQDSWYLGYICQTFDELLEAEILILDRTASNKYSYPEFDRKMNVGYNHILSEVTIENVSRQQKQFITIKLFGLTKSKFEKYMQKMDPP